MYSYMAYRRRAYNIRVVWEEANARFPGPACVVVLNYLYGKSRFEHRKNKFGSQTHNYDVLTRKEAA